MEESLLDNNLIIKNEINNDINNNIEEEQNKFIDTMIGKSINTALDIGIRAILPDFLEDQIINIKNNILDYGLKDGLKETVKDVIDLGKSAIGVVSGKFENIGQMQDAVKEGGIIDGISTLMDFSINKIEEKGIIKSNVSNMLQKGKDIILDNIENNIEKNFKEQNEKSKNLSENIKSWKEFYKEKDFDNMEKVYKKIEKEIKELAPIEATIKEAREVENLHNLIKNNGHNIELTESQIELAQKI